jgi:hypothetical protein
MWMHLFFTLFMGTKIKSSQVEDSSHADCGMDVIYFTATTKAEKGGIYG